MYDEERENRRLYVASFSDDIPNLSRGSLIPKGTRYTLPEDIIQGRLVWYMRPALLLTFSVLLFAVSIGSTGYSVFRGQMSAAAPILHTDTNTNFVAEPLHYGIELPLGQEDTFQSARATLLAEEQSFIEADLVSMKLTYYKQGKPAEEWEILSKGADGSWWQVPAGLYRVDQKKEREYSSFGNIYMPWSVSFADNFSINGIPYYRENEEVPEGYTGGGIRLENVHAERLFHQVSVGTPVLVREEQVANDSFLYKNRVDGLSAKHYLVADFKSSTVLAASDIHEVAPIASLTKLMTALVAAEHIDLEKDVAITDKSNLFTSLVPRLHNTYNASMYSLLQLLLMESSNEAAEVIAAVLGRERFIELMNEKAKALNMNATTFMDPSGYHGGNVSSMEDLMRLTQYIYHNRGFIFALTADQHLETAYTDGTFGELLNFNEVDDVSFLAGKVGETIPAGQTSVSLHSIVVDGEERVIAIIVLGSDDRATDVTRLYNYVNDQFGE